MTERRYNDEEVAAILEKAAETAHATSPQSPASERMTLAELQEIGREVGIPAESIALAARTIDHAGTSDTRRFLGFTIAVGRTVDLHRRLTDDQWERLVVDLRETFHARGSVTSHGSLRQWTNGNLQVLLEPTATGHRVRMRTAKGDAVGMMSGGIGVFGIGMVSAIAAVVQGAASDLGMVSAIGFLGIAGASMFASTAFRLPGWAETRQRQMEAIAARLAPAPESPASSPDTMTNPLRP